MIGKPHQRKVHETHHCLHSTPYRGPDFGAPFKSPHTQDDRMLGSMLGSPYSSKLPLLGSSAFRRRLP